MYSIPGTSHLLSPQARLRHPIPQPQPHLSLLRLSYTNIISLPNLDLLAFLSVLLTAYLSDRHRTRSPYIIFHALLASTGYTLMAIAGHTHAAPQYRYIGVYPAATGFFSVVTIIITWTINNQDSDSKRGTGVAMLNYIGQLGPLVGVHLYPDRDQPYYASGMAICAGFMAAVAVLAAGLRWILVVENRRLAAEQSDDGEGEGLVAENGQSRRVKNFVFML